MLARIRATIGEDAACTGYPLPLQGTAHLHLLYSQNGAELSLVDLNAHLEISLTS